MRVWGGYTPTPTFRLRLADGRSAFFKGVEPAANAFARAAHAREERVHRELSHLIEPWAPHFYAAIERDGWAVMLLEDLGPKCAPPWRPCLARRVARALADFHSDTWGTPLSLWLPPPDQQMTADGRLWRLPARADRLAPVAGLAGDCAADALAWLGSALPALDQSCRAAAVNNPPYAMLHRDVRSGNLRWVGGRLRLVAWPHVGLGPAEYDLAAFAQSVAAEGGPPHQQVVAWYAEAGPVRPEALDAAVAALAAYFAGQAWRAPIPGLPRLRPFQRRQLRVTLAWAARRLSLPPPTSLDAIPIAGG